MWCKRCKWIFVKGSGGAKGARIFKKCTSFKPLHVIELLFVELKRCKSARKSIPMKNTAKEISISKYLISQGFSPKRERPGESWFSSPLRTGDKDPSFKVDESKNLWYDFGSGTGGSIIDLAMAYHGFTFLEAITHLEGKDSSDLSFTAKRSGKSGMELLEVDRLISWTLVRYLTLVRRIDLKIARLYLGEARYRTHGNVYHALSFRNDLGGYELRSAKFKGAISPKYFTTLPGQMDGVNLFEGFMDFLSALTFYQTPALNNTSIVLNSVSNVSKLPDLSRYTTINLFLDNDEAGIRTAKTIMSQYPRAINQSAKIYPGYKDLNDYLIHTIQHHLIHD